MPFKVDTARYNKAVKALEKARKEKLGIKAAEDELTAAIEEGANKLKEAVIEKHKRKMLGGSKRTTKRRSRRSRSRSRRT